MPEQAPGKEWGASCSVYIKYIKAHSKVYLLSPMFHLLEVSSHPSATGCQTFTPEPLRDSQDLNCKSKDRLWSFSQGVECLSNQPEVIDLRGLPCHHCGMYRWIHNLVAPLGHGGDMKPDQTGESGSMWYIPLKKGMPLLLPPLFLNYHMVSSLLCHSSYHYAG